MAVVDIPHRSETRSIPPLEAGDRLDQRTFHQRYAAMPAGTRAELIEGVVYMPSAVGKIHAKPHGSLATALGTYAAHVPGVEFFDNGSAVLGNESEVQPDLSLLLTGGQTAETPDGSIAGAPELVCEIASSSESIDLHAKKREYEKYGTREYVVVAVRTARVYWFVRDDADRLAETAADGDGIFRSRIYPGLWIDPAALLHDHPKRVLDVLAMGLQSRA